MAKSRMAFLFGVFACFRFLKVDKRVQHSRRLCSNKNAVNLRSKEIDDRVANADTVSMQVRAVGVLGSSMGRASPQAVNQAMVQLPVSSVQFRDLHLDKNFPMLFFNGLERLGLSPRNAGEPINDLRFSRHCLNI